MSSPPLCRDGGGGSHQDHPPTLRTNPPPPPPSLRLGASKRMEEGEEDAAELLRVLPSSPGEELVCAVRLR